MDVDKALFCSLKPFNGTSLWAARYFGLQLPPFLAIRPSDQGFWELTANTLSAPDLLYILS